MVWQTKNKWYNIKTIKEAVSSLLLESEVLHDKANKIYIEFYRELKILV